MNRRAPQVKGYSEAGASITRRALKGFIPNSGSAHEDINRNNATLRQRSRMLYMSSPVATAAVNTNRTKIVGTGLTLKSTLDWELLGLAPEAAKTWQKRTEAEFALWSKRENCDALGLNSFLGLQQLALKSWLMSGDVFVLVKRVDPTPLNPYTLRLHLIEADRVSTPPDCRGQILDSRIVEGKVPSDKPGAGNLIYDGVEVDQNGRVVAYHICNGHPLEYNGANLEWTRVLATGANTGLPNVLHIMDAERPDQYRGVPYLAPVIEPLLQLRRYTESELMTALVQSFFSAWIQTETNPNEIPINEVGAGDVTAGDNANVSGGQDDISQSENEYEMGPGTVTHLEPGETIAFGNPNVPTSGFDIFSRALVRMIGSALELPYDVISKEFNSSYSASRGALLEAWEAFKMRRAWFVDDFCQPLYELWLAEAVARQRVRASGYFDDPMLRQAWAAARWIGPVQGSLDPLKEAKADLLLINCGIKTHEQVTRERGGGDWEENVEQLKQENELLQAAGAGTVSSADMGQEEGDGETGGE